jgi:ABC-2 type transport system permease protein
MALLPFLLILFVGGITLGIIGSAVVLRYGPAAEWLIWPLPALISPFAGVTYPLSTLPQWMQVVGTAVPPSYVFEALRGHAAPQPLLIGFVLATAYLFLACWVFVRVYKHALRSGLIARYSAESLS